MLAQVWAVIQAIPAPPPLNIPTPGSFNVTAQALPAGVPGEGTVTAYRILAVVIGITIGVAAPKAIFWGIVVGAAGSGLGAWARRNAAQSGAAFVRSAGREKEYDELVERVQRDAGPSGFHAKRAELSKLRDEHQALPDAEGREIDQLHSTAQERQKQKFLDTSFIDSATVSGVGPARKAALRSFGIETAADVSRNKVIPVRGFGESLTRAVTDWKASCERRFVFNAATAVTAADCDAVRSKFGARRVSIEAALSRGAGELQSFRQRATAQMAMLQPQLEAAARKLPQAEKDLTVL